MKTNLLNFVICFLLPAFFSYQIAKAQITYTDISPNQTDTIYHLDLNNDGITDFDISKISTNTALCGTPPTQKINYYIKVFPLNGNEVLNDNTLLLPKALNQNVAIKSASATWSNATAQILYANYWLCVQVWIHSFVLKPYTSGLWSDTDKFLGLKLYVGADTYYGWLRMNVDGSSSFTVKDYAYCSTSGKSIRTGQTNNVTAFESTVSGLPFCAGNSFNIPFIKTGTLKAGNVFTAQLSDSAGHFSNPVNIGTLTATSAGSIVATIPSNTISGTQYRVRIKTSKPVSTGLDNGQNLIISNINTHPVILGNSITCSGYSTKLSTQNISGFTYKWLLNDTIISGAVSDYYFAIQAGNYKCVVTNGCGADSSNIISVIVNPVPAAIITSNGVSICNGDSLLISANTGTGITYSWRKNSVVIPGATNSFYYADTTGSYSVITTNNFGCTKISNAIALVLNNALPAASINLYGSATICEGTTSSYLIVNAIAPGNSYQWYKDGIAIQGTGYFIYPNASGDHACMVSNGCGSATSNSITITWLPSPTAIITAATSIVFCPGGNVKLSANKSTGLTYQWQINSVNITGATDSVYYADTMDNYRVVETNFNGCVKNSNTISTYFDLPLRYISTDGVVNFCIGDSLKLYVANDTSYAYQWKRNGVNIQGAYKYQYFAKTAGKYKCKITNYCGSVFSAMETLTTSCRVFNSTVNQEISSVSVYPNPATNFVTIKFPSDDEGEILITNLFGQKIYSEKVNDGQVQVDVSKFPAGIYAVRWNSGENSETKTFFIVK